jgi:hypothetical protein
MIFRRLYILFEGSQFLIILVAVILGVKDDFGNLDKMATLVKFVVLKKARYISSTRNSALPPLPPTERWGKCSLRSHFLNICCMEEVSKKEFKKGRKKKLDKKFKQVKMSFSQTEYDKIVENWKKTGIGTIANYCAAVVLEDERKLNSDPKYITELKVEVRKQGINLNQIAKYFNTMRHDLDISRIEKMFNEVKNSLKEIIEKPKE